MSVIAKIKKLRHEAYIWKFCHTPIQENKIILWADSFKHFGCSPKYIALYLLKNYPGKFDLVWVFEDGAEPPADFPKEIRMVHYFSIDYLRELHTAKFVICNMRTGSAQYWHKRPEQIYIQTWHGFLALKKIEKDAEQYLPIEYCDSAKEDSRKTDLLLTGCKFSTEMFQKCFWYDGEIMQSLPRCDILLGGDNSVKKKVYQQYSIPKDARLLLYAPTFRNGFKAETYGMDFNRIRLALSNASNSEWVIGCRLHPNVLEDYKNDSCISMSKYSDMQELLNAADILVTDYSSTMFEMAITEKPCILYVPDLEQYMVQERGLYFNINELPFPITRNMDELCNILSNFNVGKYQSELKKFMDSIGCTEDGRSAERVCNYIREKAGLQ